MPNATTTNAGHPSSAPWAYFLYFSLFNEKKAAKKITDPMIEGIPEKYHGFSIEINSCTTPTTPNAKKAKIKPRVLSRAKND